MSATLPRPLKNPKRKLRIEFSGNLIKHLGLSMYGGPVPAIAELIANAWDADAKEVELNIPLGTPIKSTDVIEVRDFGRGMTWEEVSRDYLVVGRNRRHGGSDTSKGGRPIMGRKGIGKLAGFGIAQIVEVRTVRQRWLTHFAMDYADMTSDTAVRERYEPRIIADQATSEKPSTTVILRNLNITRAIPEVQFRRSLARRFAVLDQTFVVKVNGQQLLKSEMPLAYRFPSEPGTDLQIHVDGVGPVRYWYGFTKDTIKDDDARGIGVFVRGRLAQVPGIFNLSQGLWNQQYTQYLTGEVYADELDEEEDYVSTNRQTLNWKEGKAASLETWGQSLVKRALREYDAWKSSEDRRHLLEPLGQEAVRSTEMRLEALPRSVSHVAARLLATYRDLGSSSSSQKLKEESLRTAVDDILGLAETSDYRLSAKALLISMLEARRNALPPPDRLVSVADCAKLIRQNPWLLFSPWRVVVVDKENTQEFRRIEGGVKGLSGIIAIVIRFENTRYIVAIGAPSGSVERTLSKASSIFVRDTNVRLGATFLVSPGNENITALVDEVKVKSIGQLVSKAHKSCGNLLKMLR